MSLLVKSINHLVTGMLVVRWVPGSSFPCSFPHGSAGIMLRTPTAINNTTLCQTPLASVFVKLVVLTKNRCNLQLWKILITETHQVHKNFKCSCYFLILLYFWVCKKFCKLIAISVFGVRVTIGAVFPLGSRWWGFDCEIIKDSLAKGVLSANIVL